MSLRRTFAATSFLFLAVLAISPAKNAFRPHRAYQKEFRSLGVARARSLKEAQRYETMPIAIRQIWLQHLDDRVDRCPTCHLGAADAAMAGAPEPYRLHPATAHTPMEFDRFGCTTCHGGQGQATSRAEAHGTAEDAGPPMLPMENLEAGCGRCHAGESIAGAPVLSRGRAVMTRYGCYACHLVRDHETFRSEAPPLRTIALKTGAPWLRLWLKNPKAVDPNTTMPRFDLSDDDIEELSHALFARTPSPALAAAIASAEREPAGVPASGKKLFAEARCISCHTVEGKGHGTAPELSKVATSATRGWLLAFLRDPHAFNPRTRMPQYGFSESESRDVVAYLEDELRDFDAPKDILEPLHVNLTLAEKGEKTFRMRGCVACHPAENAQAAERFGPDLNGIGDKKATSLDFGKRDDLPRTAPAWLAAKLEQPHSFAPGLKMPTFELPADDVQAAVTALLSLGAQPVPEAYRTEAHGTPSLVPGGDVGRLVDRYRCLSCHMIGNAGGDISTAPLTFEGSKVRRAWLVDYLLVSYSIRPILEERMPIFRMPRADAELLAGAITSLYVDPRIPQDPFAGRPASDADAGEGQRLYTTLGCRACHIIGPTGGYVGPPLTDTQTRLQPGWVFTWLKGPQKWRADVRCPDYGLTDTDALRLTAYLETLKAPAADATGAKR
ncbi:MAG TPA: c-type cytochrome [Candidatus Polarisedimenticolaceae bacterium]|nr:c-type cytochrome [Candidatus Polarisedimenticolaceae bacterium]